MASSLLPRIKSSGKSCNGTTKRHARLLQQVLNLLALGKQQSSRQCPGRRKIWCMEQYSNGKTLPTYNHATEQILPDKITWQYKLGIAHICSLDPFPFSDKQDISWCKFSVTARFTLHSWTISDEQDLDLDLAAKAPSGCSQPLTSVFPSIPLRPL